MGVTGGPEAALDALVRVLHANLYTYLEAEWTQAADESTCPKPYPHSSEAWSWTSNGANVQPMTSQLPEYPVIWVRPRGGQLGANAAPVWGDYSHELEVQSHIQSDKGHVAARQALRFTWAMVRCIQHSLEDLGSTMTGSIGFTPQRYQLAPPEQMNGDVVAVTYLTVIANTEEAF